MPLLDWQDLAAILLVLTAVIYLWRRVRARVRRIQRPCCPGCPKCQPGNQDRPLVPLDPPR